MIGGEIPVRPHLKKFIQFIDHLQAHEPINIYGKGIVAHTLKMLLTFKSNIEIDEKRKLPKELTDSIAYTVNLSHFDRGKIHMTKGTIIEFDRHMHALLHEVLLQKIMLYVRYGRNEKEAIYDFADEVGIDGEISFDGLKKSNYRLRTDKNIPHFYAQKVGPLEPLWYDVLG